MRRLTQCARGLPALWNWCQYRSILATSAWASEAAMRSQLRTSRNHAVAAAPPRDGSRAVSVSAAVAGLPQRDPEGSL